MAASHDAAQSPAPPPAAQCETYLSIMRQSYRAYDNVQPPVSSSVRRQRTLDEAARHRSQSPSFKGQSNAELSYVNAVTPSPLRATRQHEHPMKARKFTETTTSRASYRSHSALSFAQKNKPPMAERGQPLKFTSTSESRRAFLNYGIDKVPPRVKETHRPITKTKFTAESISKTSYVAHTADITTVKSTA